MTSIKDTKMWPFTAAKKVLERRPIVVGQIATRIRTENLTGLENGTGNVLTDDDLRKVDIQRKNSALRQRLPKLTPESSQTVTIHNDISVGMRVAMSPFPQKVVKPEVMTLQDMHGIRSEAMLLLGESDGVFQSRLVGIANQLEFQPLTHRNNLEAEHPGEIDQPLAIADLTLYLADKNEATREKVSELKKKYLSPSERNVPYNQLSDCARTTLARAEMGENVELHIEPLAQKKSLLGGLFVRKNKI